MREVVIKRTGYRKPGEETALLEIYADKTIVRRMMISKRMFGREQLNSAKIAMNLIVAYKTAIEDSLLPLSPEKQKEILQGIRRKMEKRYGKHVV